MKIRLWIVVITGLFIIVSAIAVQAQHVKIAKSAAKVDPTTAADAIVLTCPKCQSEMEEGFFLEIEGDASNDKTATEWVQGPIQRSYFAGVKLGGRNRLPVIAFRCKTCGYLELYAR